MKYLGFTILRLKEFNNNEIANIILEVSDEGNINE